MFIRGGAAEGTAALTRPQTLIIRVDTLVRGKHTNLRVFGDPVAQNVEHSVGGSAADDEIFVAGPFRIGKNCGKV